MIDFDSTYRKQGYIIDCDSFDIDEFEAVLAVCKRYKLKCYTMFSKKDYFNYLDCIHVFCTSKETAVNAVIEKTALLDMNVYRSKNEIRKALFIDNTFNKKYLKGENKNV